MKDAHSENDAQNWHIIGFDLVSARDNLVQLKIQEVEFESA